MDAARQQLELHEQVLLASRQRLAAKLALSTLIIRRVQQQSQSPSNAERLLLKSTNCMPLAQQRALVSVISYEDCVKSRRC